MFSAEQRLVEQLIPNFNKSNMKPREEIYFLAINQKIMIFYRPMQNKIGISEFPNEN